MRTVIESVTIPASVTAIEKEAFWGCKNLKRVTLAECSKLEKIESGSFYGTGIEQITIPKGVTEISENSFSYCKNLRIVVFKDGSKLKAIGNNAFSFCKSLKNIRLPDGLEEIGAECFCESGLEEIVFPASVKKVCSAVFQNCI